MYLRRNCSPEKESALRKRFNNRIDFPPIFVFGSIQEKENFLKDIHNVKDDRLDLLKNKLNKIESFEDLANIDVSQEDFEWATKRCLELDGEQIAVIKRYARNYNEFSYFYEKVRDCNSDTYKKWRTEVFRRDNWTCTECERVGESKLEAHHIKRWRNYPELRYKVNNGITLCKDCHTDWHKKYGYKTTEKTYH